MHFVCSSFAISTTFFTFSSFWAFPNSIKIYDKELMTGRGKGKYMYKNEYRKDGEQFFIENLKKYFPNNEIKYIV